MCVTQFTLIIFSISFSQSRENSSNTFSLDSSEMYRKLLASGFFFSFLFYFSVFVLLLVVVVVVIAVCEMRVWLCVLWKILVRRQSLFIGLFLAGEYNIIPFSICPFGKILAKIEKLLTAFLWSFALIILYIRCSLWCWWRFPPNLLRFAEKCAFEHKLSNDAILQCAPNTHKSL